MGQQQPDKEDYYKHELIQQSFDLMQLARLKGFDSEKNVKSFMLEHWMPIAEFFTNTVCVVLQWWLRSKHNIDVWIKPENGRYRSGSSIVKMQNDNSSFEWAFIVALNDALNSLPPADQEK